MRKYTASEIMEGEIREILRVEPLGFTRLAEALRELRRERGELAGSSETISNALKRLAESGIVERDLNTRRWRLTTLGELITSQPSHPTSRKPIPSNPLLMLRKYLDATPTDLIRILIDCYFQTLQEGGKVKLSKEFTIQTTNQIEASAKRKTLAIAELWTEVVTSFMKSFSSFLTAILVMHGSYMPSTVRREDAVTIVEKCTATWGRLWMMSLQPSLSDYLSNPDVLTALDQAIKDRRIRGNLLGTGFLKVRDDLERQRYL